MSEEVSRRKDTLKVGKVMLPALVVTLLQYINIGRPQDILAFLRFVRPGDITMGLTLLTAFFYWRYIQGPSVLESQTVRTFRNIAILMVILIPFSIVPPKAVEYLLYEFSISIVFFLCFCQFIRTFKEVRFSILVMIISSFALALSMIIKASTGSGRISTGTTYDPNDIALLFISTLPLAFYFIRLSKGWLRIFCVLTVFVSLFAISLTQSRGAFIGLIVIVLVWISQRSNYITTRNYGKKILTIIVLIMFSSFFFPQSYWDRMETIFEEGNTGSGRMTIWPRAIKMMEWNPQGVGPGSFTTVYGRYLKAGRFSTTGDVSRARAWETAHNSYLLVGVELGFIGLALYIMWLLGMLKAISRMKAVIQKHRFNEALFQYCSMVQLSLVGFMTSAFFLSQSFSYILLTLSGYVVALERIIDAEAIDSSQVNLQVEGTD